jgi:fluoride exporter
MRHTAIVYMAVAAGTAIGGAARWLAGGLFHTWLGSGFPWGTLFVNTTGSLLIGFYAALAQPDGRLLASPAQRQFVMAGICGGYTTFSIFSLEIVGLIEAAGLPVAGVAIGASLVAWFGCVWVGFAAGTRINRLRR